MPEFLKLQPPFLALNHFLTTLPDAAVQREIIPTSQALGRVLGMDIRAPHPLPEFPRSTMDGYAVQAADTRGASENHPVTFQLIAEIPMGKAPLFQIESGQAALIHTGGMIPDGADAVVTLEQSQRANEKTVEFIQPVSFNENIILAGEDVRTGDLVIPAGRVLRAQEIGGLMSLGYTAVSVARKPVVGILSSGDEVVPPEQTPAYGQVRDINTTTMSMLIQEAGGKAKSYGIAPDVPAELERLARQAFMECDLVLITAGSSASSRDMTVEVVQRLGKPGVLAHGVSVRPGKPTILAVCDGKPVIGLPGNPVSALVIAGIFVKPVLRKLLGQELKEFQPAVAAKITANLTSPIGREDWVPVSLRKDGNDWLADPIFFKSNLIFNLVRADGLVHILADSSGLQAGEVIAVELV